MFNIMARRQIAALNILKLIHLPPGFFLPPCSPPPPPPPPRTRCAKTDKFDIIKTENDIIY